MSEEIDQKLAIDRITSGELELVEGVTKDIEIHYAKGTEEYESWIKNIENAARVGTKRYILDNSKRIRNSDIPTMIKTAKHAVKYLPDYEKVSLLLLTNSMKGGLEKIDYSLDTLKTLTKQLNAKVLSKQLK